MKYLFIFLLFLHISLSAVLLEDDFNFFDSSKWVINASCNASGGVADVTIVNGSAFFYNRGYLISKKEWNPVAGCGIKIEGKWRYLTHEDALYYSTRVTGNYGQFCSAIDGIGISFFQSLYSSPDVGANNVNYGNYTLSKAPTGTVNPQEFELVDFVTIDDGNSLFVNQSTANAFAAVNATVTSGINAPVNRFSISNREYQQTGFSQVSELLWIRISTVRDPIFASNLNIVTNAYDATFQSTTLTYSTSTPGYLPPLVTIDWGDGTSSQLNVTASNSTHFVIPDTIHTYNNESNYNVTVTLADHCGLTYNTSIMVTIRIISTSGVSPTTSRITSSPITSSPVTSAAITSASITSGDVTSSPLTTAGTSALAVTSGGTSASAATSAGTVTSAAITSGREPTSGSENGSSSSAGKNPDTAIIIAVASVAAILILIVSLILFLRSRKKKNNQNEVELAQLDIPGIKEIQNVQIIKKIGAGNFGEVFLGEWNGTSVALKKLLNKAALKEFQNEAGFLSDMAHPNCVQFFGIFTDPSTEAQYLVFEYLSKGDLKNVLQEGKGKLKEQDLVDMALTAAQGFAYLESRGVLHRDIALRNLLCTKIDGRWIAKVSDFGLSRKPETGIYETSAETKFPVKWSAPEVLKGGRFTAKSDVWSFGVTLWEIFNYGAAPYQWLTNKEAWEKIPEGERLPKSNEYSDFIYQLYQKCCSLKPDERPTFAEIVKQLKSAQNREKSPVTGVPPTTFYSSIDKKEDEYLRL